MAISYTELCDKVQSRLPEKRMRHSLGVAAVSAELADRFLLDSSVASYIGIYHDAYRYSCDESTPDYCRKHGIDVFPEEEELPYGYPTGSEQKKLVYGLIEFFIHFIRNIDFIL